MKAISIVFTIFIFATTSYGQERFFLKTKSIKAFQKSNSEIKNQLIGTKSYDLDREVMNEENYYQYNHRNSQISDEVKFYNDGVVSTHILNVYVYDGDTLLIRENTYALDENKDSTFLGYQEYYYSNNQLARVDEYSNSNDSLRLVRIRLYEYDFEERMICEEVKLYSDSQGEFTTRSKIYTVYYKENLVKEVKRFSDSDTSDLDQQRTFEYNSNDQVITEIDTWFWNGEIQSSALYYYKYDADKRLIWSQFRDYNEIEEKYVLYSNFEYCYDSKSVALARVEGFVYDRRDSSIIEEILVDAFNYTKSVAFEEILFPRSFFEFNSHGSLYFGCQLNSYKVRTREIGQSDFANGEYKEFLYSSSSLLTKEEVFEIKLIPNPAIDIINIFSKGVVVDKVEIYNASGKLVLLQPINGNITRVNIQNFEKGSYVVKAIGANSFRTKQFVKM